jgi:hypothetical protein
MKKILAMLCLMFAMFAMPVAVYAANDFNVDCSGAADSPVCQDLNSTGNPLFGADGVLTKVAKFFALLTGIISSFMIVISGLRYVTSAGDPAKTASARNGIIYSAIGMLVSAAAGAIALFILSKVS